MPATTAQHRDLHYQALSYEWGDPDVLRPLVGVLLNGHEVPATPNLRLALGHILNDPWYYWIDALCINQRDFDERAQQVRLMTRIYHDADDIDVWLGIEKGNSSLGIELINHFELAVEDVKGIENGSKTQEAVSKLWIPAYELHWDGFCQILSRSYWRRLWVIQELVANPTRRRIWLLCGLRRARFYWVGYIVKGVICLADLIERTPVAPLGNYDSWPSLTRELGEMSMTLDALTF
ncbi:hypothetical protein G7Y89_g10818 [Cudoniella acicularis]|uniref:Heterokaryon incompatibility domain-containing protein n=1 Tax=Cudoniella acicularis TaxID=354080 RepID=A0A8H4RD39_9HELO|nr:hypothetical protein G7Y89_g10818 [Cudoniella acicularis]